MADNLTIEQRKKAMSCVKSKDTTPEMRVRKLVHKLGYRFRLHRNDLPGKPDLVFPSKRKVINVNGCFWHGHKGCSASKRPKSNVGYWTKKLDRNIDRDLSNQHYSNGYVSPDLDELKEKSTLLIGLGTPRQEMFVKENYELFKKKNITTISVGGLFDFVSGYAKRAPRWVRNLNLEWAYRMSKNPKQHLDKNVNNLAIIKIILRDLLFK